MATLYNETRICVIIYKYLNLNMQHKLNLSNTHLTFCMQHFSHIFVGHLYLEKEFFNIFGGKSNAFLITLYLRQVISLSIQIIYGWKALAMNFLNININFNFNHFCRNYEALKRIHFGVLFLLLHPVYLFSHPEYSNKSCIRIILVL